MHLKNLIRLAVPLVLAGVAQAVTYTTQINGSSTGSFEIGRLEVTWSTSQPFGSAVNHTDLTDLTLSFYDDGDVLVYSDIVISGGTVQPIGGVSRTFTDVVFTATSGVALLTIDNDLNQIQFGSAGGTTYNIYGSLTAGNSANFAYYEDGGFQEDATFNITDQSTSAIPEPSAFAATAGLLGLGATLTGRRRRRA